MLIRSKERLNYTPVSIGDRVCNYPNPSKAGTPTCDYYVHRFNIRPGDDDYNIYIDVSEPTIGYVNCNNVKHLTILKKAMSKDGVAVIVPMNQNNKSLTSVQLNTLLVLDTLNEDAIKSVSNLIDWVK